MIIIFLDQEYSKKPNYIENLTAKKFRVLSFEEQLYYISNNFTLKDENPSEKYCICRRGDDSLHLMIMCENCKEWFHGMCMRLSKSNVEKISNYICLACSRRKDILTVNYHGDFINYKRVNYKKFLEFMDQCKSINAYLYEYGLLCSLKQKMEKWQGEYHILIKDLFEFSNQNLLALYNKNVPQNNLNKVLENINNNMNISESNNQDLNSNLNLTIYKMNNLEMSEHIVINIPYTGVISTKNKCYIIDDILEKRVIDLYLESEGFQVENENNYNLIIVLKYNDWFKEAFKCLEAKKYSEKLNKKSINSYENINKLQFIKIYEEDQIFYDMISTIAEVIYKKLVITYSSMNSISIEGKKEIIVYKKLKEDLLLNEEKPKIVDQIYQ